MRVHLLEYRGPVKEKVPVKAKSREEGRNSGNELLQIIAAVICYFK